MSGSTNQRELPLPAARAAVCFGSIFLFACMVLVGPVAAETRVALVIGNTSYEHAPPLANPLNDARGIAAVLRRLDFDVQESSDLDMVSMRQALRDFAEMLEDADVGLFFYAGHALQVDGQNYLAPIDAKLERSSDLIFQTVELNLVLRLLQERPRTSIIFLDACRDNPLTRSLARGLGQARSQAIGQGLADVDSGIGTLIAYATQPDNVALDGKGRHSPFTEALLEHIRTPGLEIRQMLSRVRRTVIDATARRQVPWDHSSLTGDFFFERPEPFEPEPPPVPAHVAANRSTEDVVVWSVIQWSRDAADFALFLQQYPTSPLAPYAAGRLAALRLAAEPDAGRPPMPPRPDADQEQAAAQDRPPPPPIKGPLTPGSSAAEPAADRVEGQVQVAALPDAGPAKEVAPQGAAPGPPPEQPLTGADRLADGLAAAALPDARLVEEDSRREIRSEPATERVTAALTEGRPYVEPPPKPVSVEQARAEERALDLSRDGWREVQRALNALEHAAGPADGLPGPQTRGALKAWQGAGGGRPTGYLTAAQLTGLREGPASTVAAVPTARRGAKLPDRIHDCDRLAGHLADGDRVGPGVAWEDLDPSRALPACETAIAKHPDELRFQHQYGRAQLKAGRLDDARLWFRTAAEKGYVAAQKHVGHMYMMSLGVPVDESKAVSWYRKAAEQNDPGAQYMLGLLHVLGRGVPQDNMQAITLFRRASGQGEAAARFILGWMYRQGQGVRSITSDDPRTPRTADEPIGQ